MQIVVLQVIKTPSEGLTPESERVVLTSHVPGSDTPLLTKTLGPEFAQFEGLRPMAGGFAIVTRQWSGGSIDQIVPFDLATLEPRPTGGPTGAPVEASYVIQDGWVNARVEPVPGWGNATALHFVNGQDGSELGLVTSVDDWWALPGGALFEHNVSAHAKGATPPPSGLFYFDMSTREVVGPIAPPELDSYSWYGQLVLIEGGDDDAEYLIVYDLAEHKKILEVSGEQLDGLNIDEARIGGEYLYLVNDSDNPVIDIRTSKKVSSGWALRPAARLADDWVVVIPETPGREDRGNNGSIKRGASGPYDGPWF